MALSHGTEVRPSGVRFCVWAPATKSLKLRVGGRDRPMVRHDEGWFVADVDGAGPGTRYAFVFEDGRVRPDPASRRQPTTVHAESEVFDAARFRWTDQDWKGLPLSRLVFYELHLGTFTEEGTLDAAAARLPELAELGVNTIELLPVQPFPGVRNWGYDGVAPYGVHEAYGGPEALQRFVDRAHALGLAVCLDVVYNHMGPEGNYLRDFGPYFTPRHKSPWGDGINFDGDDARPVRRFMIEAALQWLRDFHVDALRLDAVHAIVDDSEVHVLRELSDEVRELARRTGRQHHLIGESDLNERRLVERSGRGWGLDAVWADDLHHALHALVTGEGASFYQDFNGLADAGRALAEGFVYQGQHSRYRGKPHGTDTKGLPPEAFVFCIQNHDQVGNRPRGERLTALVPWEALRPLATIVLLGPALPLLFQGEEYGETRPFLYFTDHGDPDLARAVSEGRKKEFIAAGGHGEVPDPQAKETFEQSKLTHRRDGRHGELYEHYRRLLKLRARLGDAITHWPKVEVRGPVLRFDRPGVSVAVNLAPEPAGALPAWGVEIAIT